MGKVWGDVVVVGAGPSGATVARVLAEAGLKVMVIDRRGHIGGNCYDEYDPAGVLIHPYGPHIFHTRQQDVWNFTCQFTEWRLYQHEVRAFVDGCLVPIPINLNTFEALYNRRFSPEEMAQFLDQVAEKCPEPRDSKQVVVAKVGQELYHKFFHGYTLKQWGVPPESLAPEVCARIPVRFNRDNRYFADPYQGMPRDGYTRMFRRMLDHENISLLLQTDYLEIKDEISTGWTVFCGSVDAYFGRPFGPLPYRGIRFVFETMDKENYQDYSVVNYPNDYAFTRISEYKKLTGQQGPRTTISMEYPSDHGEPCYPMPMPAAHALYRRYEELAAQEERVSFLGRLGRYRYLNIDQAMLEAMELGQQLKEQI